MRGLLALLVSSACALRLPQLRTSRSVLLRSPAPMASTSADLSESIQQTIAADKVVIYSKSWCPYCTQCKALFDEMSQPYTVVELDQRDDGEQLQAALLTMTQQRTVPSVFVRGNTLVATTTRSRLHAAGGWRSSSARWAAARHPWTGW